MNEPENVSAQSKAPMAPFTLETRAMRRIKEILDELPDISTRIRVSRYIAQVQEQESFANQAAAPHVPLNLKQSIKSDFE